MLLSSLYYLDVYEEEPEACLLYKSLCLGPALGVTKFMIVADAILVPLCCDS